MQFLCQGVAWLAICVFVYLWVAVSCYD